MRNLQTREGYEWWDRFCRLPRYNFLLDENGARTRVVRWENISGTYIEQCAASEQVDQMQDEINDLKSEVAALKDQLRQQAKEVQS